MVISGSVQLRMGRWLLHYSRGEGDKKLSCFLVYTKEGDRDCANTSLGAGAAGSGSIY